MKSSTVAVENKSSRGRRRWLRYSLRGFLLLLTVFAISLGWIVDRARRETQAVRLLQAKSAEIWLEGDPDPGRRGTIDRPPQLAQDVGVATWSFTGLPWHYRLINWVSEHLGPYYVVHVGWLAIDEKEMDDPAIRALADLPRLRKIYVYHGRADGSVRKLKAALPGVEIVY